MVGLLCFPSEKWGDDACPHLMGPTCSFGNSLEHPQERFNVVISIELHEEALSNLGLAREGIDSGIGMCLRANRSWVAAYRLWASSWNSCPCCTLTSRRCLTTGSMTWVAGSVPSACILHHCSAL